MKTMYDAYGSWSALTASPVPNFFPTGLYYYSSTPSDFSYANYVLTSTAYDNTSAYSWSLYTSGGDGSTSYDRKQDGLTMRCMKR